MSEENKDLNPVEEVKETVENAVEAQAAEIAPAVVTAPTETGKKKKKGNLGFTLFLIALLIGGACYFYFTNYTPAFEVNGKKITMSMSIKDLEKNGLCLCEYNGKVIDSSAYSMKAETVMYKTYYIGVKDGNTAKRTGFTVYLMNRAKSSKKYADCNIYHMSYDNKVQSDGVTVKIGGQDFSKVKTKEEAVDLLKKAKVPISSKDLDKWAKNSDKSVIDSKDPYSITAEIDSERFVLTFNRKDLKISFEK